MKRLLSALLAICGLALDVHPAADTPPVLLIRKLPSADAIAFDPQGFPFVLAGPSARITRIMLRNVSRPFVETGGRPDSLAFDGSGDLFVADRERKAVLRIKPWAQIQDYASGFVDPHGLAIGPDGAVFVADSGASALYRISHSGAKTLLASGLPGAKAVLYSTVGNCFFIANGERRIWRVGRDGRGLAVFADLSDKGRIGGLAGDEAGNLYVARDGAGKVSVLDFHGKPVRSYTIPGPRVAGVAFGGVDFQTLFVTEANDGAVYLLHLSNRSQRLPWESDKPLRITDPPDGSILNRHDGAATPDGLEITVKGVASNSSTVRINGVPAQVHAGHFQALVTLTARENRISARAPNGSEDAITLLWDRDSFPRYRISADDNIWFLKDIALHADTYRSIFENPYLEFWRDMHRKYGAKVHFNIYYETPGFNLSQMPGKYRAEWQANADWIRLSFHARADQPDYIYLQASADQVRNDYRMVNREIERFAGREVMSPITTLHWGICPRAVAEALRDEGVRGFVTTFWSHDEIPYTIMYLPVAQWRYAAQRDYWKDTRLDLLFVRHDIILNLLTPAQIGQYLERVAADPHSSEIIEMVIHEQYFYPDYRNYEPDYRARVEAGLAWVTRRGYQSVLFDQGFLGAGGK